MAKKPQKSQQRAKESKTKVLIRDYLLDENLMRGHVIDAKLDFGFKFVFPAGTDSQGRQRGRPFTVVKPKEKDFIEISSATLISPEHQAKLKDKKKHFFAALHKFLLNKNLFFNLDAKNNRYVLIDNIFLKRDGTVSKNSFYRSVRKIFTSTVYSIVLLKEFCEDVLDLDDVVFR